MVADGLVRGIDPIVAQAHGARDGESAALALQRGVVIAVGVSIPLAVLWLFTEKFLLATGQNPELAALAQRYVLVQIPSIVCHMVYMALRGYLQGRAIMNPALWVMVFANVVHIFGNWVLIFGHLGAPALGVVGAGIATSLTRTLALAALVWMTLGLRLHEGAWRPWSREAFSPAGPAPGARARPAGRAAGGPRGLGLPDRDADGRKARRERARRAPDRAQHGLADLHGAARDRDRRLHARGQPDRRGPERAGAARRLGRLRARRRARWRCSAP